MAINLASTAIDIKLTGIDSVKTGIAAVGTDLKKLDAAVGGGGFNLGNVFKGLAFAAAGVGVLRVGVSALKGDWAGVGDVVDALPFGIGRLAKELANVATEFDFLVDLANKLGARVESAASFREFERAADEANKHTATLAKQAQESTRIKQALADEIVLLRTKSDLQRDIAQVELTAEQARRQLPPNQAQKDEIENLIELRRSLQLEKIKAAEDEKKKKEAEKDAEKDIPSSIGLKEPAQVFRDFQEQANANVTLDQLLSAEANRQARADAAAEKLLAEQVIIAKEHRELMRQFINAKGGLAAFAP